MNRQPYSKPPRWWPPKLSRWWIRFWRRVRLREQVAKHRLVIEGRYGLDPREAAIPERVKSIRRAAIDRLADLPPDDPAREQFLEDLDNVLLVVQGFKLPGRLRFRAAEHRRIAETLDKFEEDVLGALTATVRGTRKAIVTFSEPIGSLLRFFGGLGGSCGWGNRGRDRRLRFGRRFSCKHLRHTS